VRKILILLTMVVIFPLFTLTASADEGVDKYLFEFENAVPEEYREMATSPDLLEERIGLSGILHEIYGIIAGEGGDIVSLFLFLIGATLAFALAEGLAPRFSDGVTFGVGVAVSSVLASRFVSYISVLSEDLGVVSDFFATLIPIFSAVSLSGGGVRVASVHAAAMNTTVTLLSATLTPIFTSVSGLAFILSVLAALDKGAVGNLFESIKGFFTWMLGIVTALIMGTLALQTVIGAVRDGAAIRAARYAASGMIPVVGGTVAASLATLGAGLAYVKGVIGIGAAAVILSLLLSPLVMLLLNRAALSLAVSFSDALGISSASSVFAAFRRGLDLFVAVYAVSVLLYIFEIILFVITEVPIG